jgi:hypothetical protein
MGISGVDLGSALRRLADSRIEGAMRQGAFDNLPGAGKPLELEPAPADEAARMTWWMLRIMKRHDFTPHEVVWRKTIDRLKDELVTTAEQRRRAWLVTQINELVRKVNTLGTNAMSLPMVQVSMETAQERRTTAAKVR